MSAPEVRVRVERRASDDTYYAECGACRQILATGYTSVATLDLALAEMDHENDCAPTQLARLHARWDARDAALRTLVAEWRQIAADEAADSATRHDAARITVMEACADRLERTMRGAR